MVAKDIEKEIRELVGNILEQEPDQIDPNAHLVEDLGMDSMMALEILAALEKKYKTRLPENELPQITTLNRVIKLAKKYVNDK